MIGKTIQEPVALIWNMLEVTVYPECKKRKRTGRFIVEFDGQEVAILSDLSTLQEVINTERKARGLRWKQVGTSYVYQKKKRTRPSSMAQEGGADVQQET